MELPSNTLLHNGKYRIIQKIGQGGFGIAYKANQVSLNRIVCIKEFFFSDLCERADDSFNMKIISTSLEKLKLIDTFKKKFIKEAKRLAEFQHPNIVQVMDVFEENNTAYFVMEYLEGGSLEDLIRLDGALSEHKTKELILPIIDALNTVHVKGLLHLDIKPSNIMLRKNQTPVLIDFGISKYMEVGNQNTNTTAPIGYSDGYSPIEQSSFGSSITDFTKATDIYSLCATIYKMATGITPPIPHQIITNGLKSPKDLKPVLSANFNSTIVKGLSIKVADRQQTCSQLRKEFGELKKDSTTTLQTKIEISEPKPTTANAYFTRAETKRKEKKFNEAILDYTEAIKLKNTDEDFYFYRALCYHELKNYKAAIKDYSKVIDINPKENAAFYNRGLVFREQNQNENAINDYYKAFEIKQTDKYFDEWFSLAKYINNKSILDNFLKKDWPNKGEVYILRGKLFLKNNEREKAKEDFSMAEKYGSKILANSLLKSITWKSPQIINYHIILILSNIILLCSTYYVFSKEVFIDEEKWHWTVIPMIFSIFYSFFASFPHWDAKAKLHINTESGFQKVEKIIYSFINVYLLLLISYFIYRVLTTPDGSIAENRVILTLITSIFMIFPIYSLYLIWSKSKKRNIQELD